MSHDTNQIASLANARPSDRHPAELALAELEHRVRNQFQLFGALVRTACAEIDHPAAQARVERLGAYLEALVAVHACLSLAGGRGPVDLATCLQRLCAALGDGLATPRSIELLVSTEGMQCAVAPEVVQAAGMIVAELVTNAVKHAFTRLVDAPRIEVRCSVGPIATIVVTDNGRGLERSGFRDRERLGSALVARLASRLGGDLTVDCAEGFGTRAVLRFPTRC